MESSSPATTVRSRIVQVVAFVGAVIVLLMTGLVALASVMRYFLDRPFDFTEELVALLYVALVFLTIPLASFRDEHIRVTLLTDRLGARAARVMAVVACLVVMAFSLWFLSEAVEFARFAHQLGEESEQVGLLLWPWKSLLAASILLVAVIAAWRLVQALRGKAPVAPDVPQDGL